MEPDAVQIENKPFECRFILLGALGQIGVSNAQVWECAASRSPLKGACLWQGSQRPFECSRVVPGIIDHESSDVHFLH